MPLFYYKGLQENGKVIEQTIQAHSQDEVVALLRSKSLRILSIKSAKAKKDLLQGGVSVAEKANFCRYLAVMIKSGLAISEAVETIQAETENKRMKSILQDMSFALQEGGEISQVLTKYPDVFDEVFLALVRAGEQSGSLEKTFEYLSQQLYASHRLNNKIKGAMMYPMVIFAAMGGVGILMMTFVLPRLGSVFLKMNIPLPTPTRLLLEFGNFMGKNVVLVFLSLIIIGVIVATLFKTHQTRKFLMAQIANFPVVKKLFRQTDLARFSRTLATLLQSGVPIVAALNISSAVFSQFGFIKLAKNFEKGVTEGKTIASMLTDEQKTFPSIMVQTIKTGEKTGTLDSVLLELADYYEAELEDALKEFTTILEPVIMLIIGVAVGAMVIMIIAPIYSVLGGLQSSMGK
ncbi:type II secretion system F family protein [Candidatus Beckwithbacteria bacterium]|nr:type II secretion system F family protein [Candidatus Beckwithbacteria bacterium]